MNDFLTMNILDTTTNSKKKTLDLGSQETTSYSSQFIQRLIFTKLKEYIHVLSIFKAIIEFDNIRVVQSLMQFDLIS